MVAAFDRDLHEDADAMSSAAATRLSTFAKYERYISRDRTGRCDVRAIGTPRVPVRLVATEVASVIETRLSYGLV